MDANLRPSQLRMADPIALGVAGFAVTEGCLGIVLMGWRGVTMDDAFVVNFFGIGGIGMLLAAQWVVLRRHTFSYTVLSSYGLLYLGLGFLYTPLFDVAAAYGGSETPAFNNAIGLLFSMWTALNTIFLLGSFRVNLCFVFLFIADELGMALAAAGYFMEADGSSTATSVQCTSGACCFVAAILALYYVTHLLCQDVLGFELPVGDTSHFSFFKKHCRDVSKKEEV